MNVTKKNICLNYFRNKSVTLFDKEHEFNYIHNRYYFISIIEIHFIL